MKLRDFVTDDEKRYPFSSWGRCLITAGKPKVQLEVGSCIKHCVAHAIGYSKGLRYANAGDWALLVLLLAFFSWAAINSREGRANLNGDLCWCGIYWHWYCRDLVISTMIFCATARVGGRTDVNHDQGDNQPGAFWPHPNQPKLIRLFQPSTVSAGGTTSSLLDFL